MCLSVALFVGALTLFLTNGLLCVILYKDDIYGRSASTADLIGPWQVRNDDSGIVRSLSGE